MRWQKRDKYHARYVKRFTIFPRLYGNTWYWLEWVYLFRRYRVKNNYDGESFIIHTDELVSKEEYLAKMEEGKREKDNRG